MWLFTIWFRFLESCCRKEECDSMEEFPSYEVRLNSEAPDFMLSPSRVDVSTIFIKTLFSIGLTMILCWMWLSINCYGKIPNLYICWFHLVEAGIVLRLPSLAWNFQLEANWSRTFRFSCIKRMSGVFLKKGRKYGRLRISQSESDVETDRTVKRLWITGRSETA